MHCDRDDECSFGLICRDKRCLPGCRVNHQCPPHKHCLSGQCRNPCTEGLCAVNAHCVATSHQAHCTCRPGFFGDGHRECRTFVAAGRSCQNARQCGSNALCSKGHCRLGCEKSEQCDPQQACVHGRCQSPCALYGVCGRRSFCSVRNHTAHCECPEGYRGNPNLLCTRAPAECSVDTDCQRGQICESSQCVNGCREDHNCLSDQACLAGQCGNPCLQRNSCGQHTRCYVYLHRARCECELGFAGNPYSSCDLIPKNHCGADTSCGLGYICEKNRCQFGCRSEVNCRFEQACINQQCSNPCEIFGACGRGAICTSFNHDRVCSCPPSTSGDPRISCESPTIPISCSKDEDCPLAHLCSLVSVSNISTGFVNGRCVVGCRSSKHCPIDQWCRNGQCDDPCNGSGVCGLQAVCSVVSHEPVCSCPAGMRGQPERGGTCLESGFECSGDNECGLEQICLRAMCVAGCRTHANCPSDKSCVNGQCQSPCALGGMCGVNSICRAVAHEAKCSCAPGYSGDPLRQCSRSYVECESASDCGRGYVCVNNNCRDINECLQEKLPCGPSASCSNEPGWFRCQCPPPLVGNPYDLKNGCRQPLPFCLSDRDCQKHQKCNPLTQECYGMYLLFIFLNYMIFNCLKIIMNYHQ